ncbi:hypothetical protein FRC06_006285 [Ceratobasidium sp. 370]|nr:hypothetical protein FRC06_006285 [Ceratobasidium sp. 370]
MSSSSTLLHGKKMIVTEGSSGTFLVPVPSFAELTDFRLTTGMGRAVAAASLSNGVSVIISSSSEVKIKAAVELLSHGLHAPDGPLVTGYAVDITNSSSLAKFLGDMGPVDHLLVHKNKLINLGGSLIMTMGVAFNRLSPVWALVAGLMEAVESARRGLALDIKPTRVNTVNPGLVTSELWDGLAAEARDAMYDAAAQKPLVGHVGTPEELIEAYIFAMEVTFANQTYILF